MEFKQYLILDKSKSNLVDNKFYRFDVKQFRIAKYKIKLAIFPDVSLPNSNKTRIDTILSGSSDGLDQFIELVTDYTNKHDSQKTYIDSADTTATTDRAAIRTEFAAADTTINTSITNLKARLPNEYYFDSSNFGDENGSKLQPYQQLSSFAQVILVGTPRKIVVNMNGSFDTDVIQINHANWDITINGNSNTVITSDSGDISKYVFLVNTCKRLEINDLEINTCLYGIRTYLAQEVVINNVKLLKCGSTGVLANHTTETQANLATKFAAGTELSNGGALRLRTSSGVPNGRISVTNCFLEFCLRAIRIEGCDSGEVHNNNIRYCSDNGIYLRKCNSVLVSSNNIFNMGHVSLQSIYSKNCEFNSNHCVDGWGASICNYGSVNISYNSNNFENCCTKNHTGYGSTPSDSHGQVLFRSDIDASLDGDFIGKVVNNTFTKTTTLNSVIVRFTENIKASYTTDGSDKFYFEGNLYPDGMTITFEGWTITNLNQAGGSPFDGTNISVPDDSTLKIDTSSTGDNAHLHLKCNRDDGGTQMAIITLEVEATANSSQSSKTELLHTEGADASILKTTFWNPSNNTHDDYNHLFMRRKHTGIGTDWNHNPGEIGNDPLFCCQPPSQFLENVVVAPPNVAGGTTNSCDFFKIGSGNTHATDPGTDFIYTNPKAVPTSTSSDGVKGTIRWDNNFLYIATDLNLWKTIPLQTFSTNRNVKKTEYYSTSEIEANAPTIATDTEICIIGSYSLTNNHANSHFFLKMPANPKNGHTIKFVGQIFRDSTLADCKFIGNGTFFHPVRGDNENTFDNLGSGTFDVGALGYEFLTLRMNDHSYDITYFNDGNTGRWYAGSTGNVHSHTHVQH